MPNSILLRFRKNEQVILITFLVIKKMDRGGRISPPPHTETVKQGLQFCLRGGAFGIIYLELLLNDL